MSNTGCFNLINSIHSHSQASIIELTTRHIVSQRTFHTDNRCPVIIPNLNIYLLHKEYNSMCQQIPVQHAALYTNGGKLHFRTITILNLRPSDHQSETLQKSLVSQTKIHVMSFISQSNSTRPDDLPLSLPKWVTLPKHSYNDSVSVHFFPNWISVFDKWKK